MSLNRENLARRFQEEYDRLNTEQRRAVDTIEGPVMVIAGPGTGKTQILASRIGKILLETDTLPENILCLTYTDAGALAMRKRLLYFIGPDAYKVNIYTYHAFCNDVIQENLSLFEKTALDAISELESIELFKQLIDTLPKSNPLKRYRGDVYYEVKNLQSLFNTMKQEGWTPDFVTQRVNEYLADLPNRDDFRYKKKYRDYQAGDLKQDKFDAEKEKMEKLKAAAGEFDRFQQLMRQKNRYDFADMINWVIRAFEENKTLLANYQERYQYVLVDEYQDTSGTQNRLVELLISYWDKPNIFVVGDDDQSIFRFQGANVQNMLDFASSYKNDLLTVVLTNNYRSTQPILDVSKTLIGRNKERLVNQLDGLTKDLTASNKSINQLLHTPVLKEYDTPHQEMIGIVRDIQILLANQVNPGKIAIIYKENSYGLELAQYFKLLDLPVFSKKNLNILDLPLAQKIILVLKYLAAEHDISFGGDEMLFEILHFDWFGIPPIEVAKTSIEASMKKAGENRMSIRQLLSEKNKAPAADLFTPNLHPGLQRASQVLEDLIAAVPNVTLQGLFEEVILKAGVLNRIMQNKDKHNQLQILTGLFNFVKTETHRNPTLTLQQLVNLIELMEKEKIRLPLVEVTGNERAVNLLTVHGSKGLEYEYVFFAGCNAGFWEKKRMPHRGYSLPDTIFSTTMAQGVEEELRRLFYVALTRAQLHLHLSFSANSNEGKALEPSMFIAEILDQHELGIQRVRLDDDTLDRFSSLHFGQLQAPEIDKIEAEFIDRILEKFVMNVTALNNYLRCPLEFYFKNLVRIPSPKNEATEFGSSVHYALEQLFRKMQDSGQEVFPSQQEFIADFEWYMHRHRENFTKEQFDRRLEYGQQVLANYYQDHLPHFNKIVAIERNIRNVMVKDVPLKGKLDKLEFDGRSVNVVDYKTGDPDKAMAKIKGPSGKDPNGGDYWRQAVFYKILVDNYSAKDWKVTSTEFDFIEPDKKKKYRKEKLVITEADMTTVTQQIVEAWGRIQKKDFYTGCGKKDCHWCNFVKTNDFAIALHNLGDTDEEDSSDLQDY